MVRGAGGGGGGARGGRPPLGELLFTGEVGRAPELPLAGRRAAAERRMASARVGARLGGDLVPRPVPPADVDVRGGGGGGTGGGLPTWAVSCANDICIPGVWTW